MNWNLLEDVNKLEKLVNVSESKAVLIFKHSTRCGISRFALNNFERSFDISEDKLTPFYLDLLKFREISNEIANTFDVQHQSPQVIVLKNKEVVYSESHSYISIEDIKKAIS
ncbi:bacillithiol system redox-active protein YtxJ [uncultured Lutibacter sp.]|uniref:bacillithiol system redox-active protein YtxJ n=1 Tax=uncultured Lutibacter sp. TaxID=437739 RepID=UPI002619C8CC|nr:bacillithiol system redox-active protein YtxJ [uncultured Lutibacter sp.]